MGRQRGALNDPDVGGDSQYVYSVFVMLGSDSALAEQDPHPTLRDLMVTVRWESIRLPPLDLLILL